MPSSIAHAFTAAAVGAAILPQPAPRRLVLTGVACAVLLDVDAIGRPFGHGDIAWLGGHRGLTHSLFFAVIGGALLTFLWRPSLTTQSMRLRAFAFLALSMIAHGILDAFTDYGDGIAYFAPFSWRRFESSWKPFQGLWEEVFLVWLPCYLFLRHTKRTRNPVAGVSKSAV